MWFNLALRLFRRELGRGELTVISLAIILSVLSVMTLGGVSQRVESAIMQKSTGFIAADRIMLSPQKLPEDYFDEAPMEDIEVADQVRFSSMIYFDENLQFADVKAVSESYPLRGDLLITQQPESGVGESLKAPKPGEAYVAKRLYFGLNLSIGDEIEIGVAKIKVAGVIVEEPDNSFSVFTAAPRVLMNAADIARTEVVQPGSRIAWRKMFAGPKARIDELAKWLKPKLKENEFLYGVKDAQSSISGALQRAEQFLLLAGLLGIVLAAVAIAVAAQRYCQRHYDPVAIFKTIGGSRVQIRRIYITHLLLVTFSALIIGLVAGYGLQSIAVSALSEYLPDEVPPLTIKPILMAVITGISCSLMFSAFPLMQLFEIPAIRILRRNVGDAIVINRWHMVVSALTVLALMLLYSQNLKITAILFFGGIFLIVILMVLSQLVLRAGRSLGMRPSSPFHLAMASLRRRAQSNSIQLITFSTAIMLLLTIFILKNEILQEWQAQLPEGTPNHFLVNVAQHEVSEVETFWQKEDVTTKGLYPVVRGRLSVINDEKVRKFVSKEDGEREETEGRVGIGREINLTWRADLPAENTIVEGEWFTGEEGEMAVSVETNVADRLSIGLGDKLTFLIGAREVVTTVTSLREVDWNTMQPNFFMILSPGTLNDFPATYITSFYLPAEQKLTINNFLRNFPTITVIEVDTIIKQIQSVIGQVSTAIQFVLIIVIVAGVLVLSAQVQSSMEERKQETVILRTLGAKGSLIRWSIALEFLLLGVIAGFMATFAAEATLWVLQSSVFNMEPSIHWSLWWIGPVTGGAFVSIVGLLMTVNLLRTRTADLLRVIG